MAQEFIGASIDAPRRLPFSSEAEQALLGSIINDPDRFKDVANLVRADDFYIELHRSIFEAIQSLFLQSRNIHIVNILDLLVQNGESDTAKNKSYIKLLSDSVPVSGNITDYARIISEKAMLRKLLAASEKISEMAYAAEGDAETIIDNAEQEIFKIASDQVKGFTHIRDVIVQHYSHLQELLTDREAAMGIPTYFSGIDKLLIGMGKGDLVIVGARPGMGKTAFCLNIATNVACKKKKAVAIFSLEMSNEQIVSRMLSSEALIDSYKMRSGELEPSDWTNLARAAGVLSETDIFIDDTSGITVTQMKAKLRRLKNLGLVIIDYLQLMNSDTDNPNQAVRIGEISRNLKLLAKDLQVPVITCAQLNRGVEGRTDKTPMASDLRDSGAIEQDADIIMFLYRDDYYNRDDPSLQNIAKCIISKNRHGSTGTADLGWYGQYTKFISVDNTHDDGQ
ncbi:MAG: replicative DNA helicase [Clostridia bacterium]|nr:replicative DNA helicase [Clostridia bacterium]